MRRPLERHIAVTRTARYWVVGEEVERPTEIWFVLHGYRQLGRRFLRRFESLADGTRFLVAPEALSRFYVGTEQGRHGPESVVGGTWMTKEDRENEIRDYVGYLDQLAAELLEGARAEAPVTVLGFSQGVATAARWVTYGAVRPRRVVLWGGYLPPDLDMELAATTLGRAELVIVRGEEDPSRDEGLEADEAARMGAAGIEHRLQPYPGGHEIDDGALAELLGV